MGVAVKRSSCSTGVAYSSFECRRCRLQKISMYSNIAFARSVRMRHFFRFNSSICMLDQNDSFIELS